MPNWQELLNEVGTIKNPYDATRHKYLEQLHKLTGRNVIVYYSGWLQKPEVGGSGTSLDDNDKNGFMAVLQGVDKTKGLDLFLHTPGGGIAATESIVDYLRQMFGNNIRAIVPQIAMSAGTMIACSCKEIIMGKHSSLGPVDPQIMGVAAHGILEEFEQARQDCIHNPQLIPFYQAMIAKYPPSLIVECSKAIELSEEIVGKWLASNMFLENGQATASSTQKAEDVLRQLASKAEMKTHDRHISKDRAIEMGLKITSLEDDKDLQEAVLTVHHACIATLSATPAIKIVENHTGTSVILQQVG